MYNAHTIFLQIKQDCQVYKNKKKNFFFFIFKKLPVYLEKPIIA